MVTPGPTGTMPPPTAVGPGTTMPVDPTMNPTMAPGGAVMPPGGRGAPTMVSGGPVNPTMVSGGPGAPGTVPNQPGVVPTPGAPGGPPPGDIQNGAPAPPAGNPVGGAMLQHALLRAPPVHVPGSKPNQNPAQNPVSNPNGQPPNPTDPPQDPNQQQDPPPEADPPPDDGTAPPPGPPGPPGKGDPRQVPVQPPPPPPPPPPPKLEKNLDDTLKLLKNIFCEVPCGDLCCMAGQECMADRVCTNPKKPFSRTRHKLKGEETEEEKEERILQDAWKRFDQRILDRIKAVRASEEQKAASKTSALPTQPTMDGMDGDNGPDGMGPDGTKLPPVVTVTLAPNAGMGIKNGTTIAPYQVSGTIQSGAIAGIFSLTVILLVSCILMILCCVKWRKGNGKDKVAAREANVDGFLAGGNRGAGGAGGSTTAAATAPAAAPAMAQRSFATDAPYPPRSPITVDSPAMFGSTAMRRSHSQRSQRSFTREPETLTLPQQQVAAAATEPESTSTTAAATAARQSRFGESLRRHQSLTNSMASSPRGGGSYNQLATAHIAASGMPPPPPPKTPLPPHNLPSSFYTNVGPPGGTTRPIQRRIPVKPSVNAPTGSSSGHTPSRLNTSSIPERVDEPSSYQPSPMSARHRDEWPSERDRASTVSAFPGELRPVVDARA